MAENQFVWRGRPLTTYGVLFTAALAAAKDGEAAEFLTAYRAASPHADANLGYLIGYGDEDSRRLMYEAFDLSHPVFGGRP